LKCLTHYRKVFSISKSGFTLMSTQYLLSCLNPLIIFGRTPKAKIKLKTLSGNCYALHQAARLDSLSLSFSLSLSLKHSHHNLSHTHYFFSISLSVPHTNTHIHYLFTHTQTDIHPHTHSHINIQKIISLSHTNTHSYSFFSTFNKHTHISLSLSLYYILTLTCSLICSIARAYPEYVLILVKTASSVAQRFLLYEMTIPGLMKYTTVTIHSLSS